jgi:hypothetical protein
MGLAEVREMTEAKKPHKPVQAPDPGPHPETKRHSGPRVPDENGSQVAPDARPDPRGGHDKDGNERQAASPRRARP